MLGVNYKISALEETLIDGPPTILITNVMIYDGTGAKPFKGQVRIKGDRILHVEQGEQPKLSSDSQVINGQGLDLAPGFIDTHSHHDIGLDTEPNASAAITQGVTTIVRGMDGFSGGPVDADYFSVNQYLEYFQSIPVAINVASFSAHNSIRLEVMGEDFKREATAKEIMAMASLIELDMRSGAYGLSTGLEYDPGIFSSTLEVIELAKVAANYDGKYKSHIRSEDREYWEAIEETVEIGRQAKIPVNIDHFKLLGTFNWGRTDEVLSILDAAREEGINITTDVYPYVAWSSSITSLYPKRNFNDIKETEFILEKLSPAEDITFVYHSLHPDYVQKTVAEIANEAGKSEVEMLSHLSEESYRLGSASSAVEYVVAKGMIDSDVRLLLDWPYSNVTSDGGLECSHPRGCGTFPKVISKYRGEGGLGSLERIIYKMTNLSATNIGLIDRGIIKEGAFADIVMFDAKNTKDNSTFSNSTLQSEGIDSVWVNGIRVLSNGEFTGELPGRLLLKNKE
jgi:N-acyl-D-amino-acid deacylase